MAGGADWRRLTRAEAVLSFTVSHGDRVFFGGNGDWINFLTVLSWWAIAVLGALVGGLLLYAYHAWAVRRGFAAWSTLLLGTGDAGDGTTTVSAPPWRRLWLWILLSFVVLAAGIVLGVIGTAL